MTVGPRDTEAASAGFVSADFESRFSPYNGNACSSAVGCLPQTLDMSDLFEPHAVQDLTAVLESASSPADALKAWGRRKEQ